MRPIISLLGKLLGSPVGHGASLGTTSRLRRNDAFLFFKLLLLFLAAPLPPTPGSSLVNRLDGQRASSESVEA